GMAMRGGAVISHLKVGSYASPLIRAGQADVALFLAEENLSVHPHLIGPRTKVLVSSEKPTIYEGLDAEQVAEETVGRRQSANLVLLGYGLGKGCFFAPVEKVRETLQAMSRTPALFEANEKALEAGLARAK
ncbi:MAG: 2-oxoacid:acceptor oxidoreductase family protein, partial [Thermodesulfobacteriota bacterium]